MVKSDDPKARNFPSALRAFISELCIWLASKANTAYLISKQVTLPSPTFRVIVAAQAAVSHLQMNAMRWGVFILRVLGELEFTTV